MQSSKMASVKYPLFDFESDIGHLKLAMGVGDTVRETLEAGLRHSHRCTCSLTLYELQS